MSEERVLFCAFSVGEVSAYLMTADSSPWKILGRSEFLGLSTNFVTLVTYMSDADLLLLFFNTLLSFLYGMIISQRPEQNRFTNTQRILITEIRIGDLGETFLLSLPAEFPRGAYADLFI